ncbi:MAG: glycosyltransferase family 2 protein [Bacteroidota bacterium]|nr:glycosyltransferase family 2 protein [Bacteroidota bacterium]
MKQPLVSVITVCYNAKDVIEPTISSVRKQTYRNLEYIVIDGDSTDGTKEIIEQNRDAITKYVSEKDNGLYYAMNKGLDMAEGEYVWFINAGDRIPHSNTLEKIMDSSLLEQDIYYGRTKIINKKGEVIANRRLKEPEVLDKNSFRWGMLVCHQAAIVRRSIAPYYNTKYKIDADFEWLLTSIENSNPTLIRHSKRTYCYFLEGGFSKQRMWQANTERYKIMIKHYGFLSATCYNILMTFRYIKDRFNKVSMT